MAQRLHMNRATPIGFKATKNGYVLVLARATSAVPGRQAPVLSLGQEFTGLTALHAARQASGEYRPIPADEPASVTLGRLA